MQKKNIACVYVNLRILWNIERACQAKDQMKSFEFLLSTLFEMSVAKEIIQ